MIWFSNSITQCCSQCSCCRMTRNFLGLFICWHSWAFVFFTCLYWIVSCLISWMNTNLEIIFELDNASGVFPLLDYLGAPMAAFLHASIFTTLPLWANLRRLFHLWSLLSQHLWPHVDIESSPLYWKKSMLNKPKQMN